MAKHAETAKYQHIPGYLAKHEALLQTAPKHLKSADIPAVDQHRQNIFVLIIWAVWLERDDVI